MKSPSDPIDQMLADMTLEQKLGQLFLVYFEGAGLSDPLREMICEYQVGGVILYTIAGNLETPGQVAQLNRQMQELAPIPLWIGIDQEGGSVSRLPAGCTEFPSMMAIGATGSLDHARRMAAVTASELKALGINLNFAPVVDVNSNPANPIIGIRSFGSDPGRVAEFGVAMMESYHQAGILTTPKHFPGHGDTDVDSHLGLPLIDQPLEHLEQIELVPFAQAIRAGAEAIMTAHVVVPALGSDQPATLAPEILQTCLRQQMGFTGVIITDSLTMGALEQAYGLGEAALLSLQAGADILLFGADRGHTPAEQKAAYVFLLAQLKAGEIPLARLDESVHRILTLKARYGLLDYRPSEPQLDCLGSEDHWQVAHQIACASITLVQQASPLLPLQSSQSILVIWPRQRGDFGSQMAEVHPQVRSLVVELDPSAAEIEQAIQLSGSADVLIVGTFSTAQHPQQVRLVQALPPERVIAVAIGSPYDCSDYPGVNTILATYSSSRVSLAALVEVLTGSVIAKGRLPVRIRG